MKSNMISQQTMQNQRTPAQPSHSHLRHAFTLVELLVVIIIIAILMALLLPAIGGVRQRAREAQVVVDIKNLDTAIANFKLAYGMDPPSSFSIHEDGVWDMNNPLDRNSVALIRQLWPQYQLTPIGTDMSALIDPGDVNGNQTITDDLILNGAECLAFFLGGIVATDKVDQNGGNVGTAGIPTKWNALGFSANPGNPFARGGARKGPFFGDKVSERFANIDGASNTEAMPELLDTLPNQQKPYLYFSSYNGRGYQPYGYDGVFGLDDEFVDFGVSPAFAPSSDSVIYRTGAALADAPINAKSYQIISPGFDGEYFGTALGRGGHWSNEASFLFPSNRQLEQDNITNFAGGRLD